MDKDKMIKVTKKLFICDRHTKGKRREASKKASVKSHPFKKLSKRTKTREDKDL
jgi:hypothetical protein